MLVQLEVKLNVFFIGYGLKCYECVSIKSWDDCVDVKEEMICFFGFDCCIKGYV